VDFEFPRLCLPELDGSKAFRYAVQQDHARRAAVVRRCQVHKIAISLHIYAKAKTIWPKPACTTSMPRPTIVEPNRRWGRLLEELKHGNPSAAHSLAEGMEDTIAGHRLRMALLSASVAEHDESDRVGVYRPQTTSAGT
jgi:hypothetical protein